MSVADTYTLGVRLTGDLQSLRQELAQGKQLVESFSSASVQAMTRAADAINRASSVLEQSASKTSNTQKRSQESQQQQTRKTATAYEEYMRRVTAADKSVAASSEQAAQKTTSALGGIGSTLGRLTGAAGFGLLAKQVWDTGLGFHEFTQNTQVALTTLLGTEQAAKSFLSTILDFAKTTPYAFTDLTTQAQKLITYGFQTEQIVPILTAVGDAATGMGKGVQGIDNIVRALGQINTKGRLQSEELLQLSENGVNGLKILANQAGMSTLEYQKLITKGLIPAEDAIAGLVNGIEDGTDGVNGQTAAFGGLMDKIKGSGGITATMDSAKTGFRNAAAAVTDALVPAYTDFIGLATRGLGVVKDTANVFNGLPTPVQNSALAFGATAVAVKLLNVEGRSSAIWSTFATHMQASKAAAQAMGYEAGAMRTAIIAARAGASGLGSALLGAFGGPVGLAVTGVVAAIAAFASAQSQAKAEAQEVAATLDEVTGKVSENTREWVKNQLVQNGGLFGREGSAADAAQKLRIDLETVTDAAMGSADALKRVYELTAIPQGDESNWSDAEAAAVQARADALGVSAEGYVARAEKIRDAVKGTNGTIEEAIRVADQKAKMDGKAGAALSGVTQSYRDATNAAKEFTEEQVKAIQSVEDAAEKAFTAGLKMTGRDLDLSTADDVLKAQESVADATDRVRDAEDRLAEVRGAKSSDAADIARAEREVADARRAAQEAADELTDTEARRDPVAQYKKQLDEMRERAQSFADDIKALAEGGLNGQTLLELINGGPEANQDMIKALLGDPSLIGETNSTTDFVNRMAQDVSSAAGLAATYMESGGSTLGDGLATAFKVAALSGTATTVQELADQIGADPQALYDAGMKAGLTWLAGLSDAAKFQQTMRMNADGTFQMVGPDGNAGPRGYATGGIYPGYTPGKDVGFIGVSGGEAIMRPEWTRAVGSGFVHRMNALARTSGVGGVRAEMARYLGGFASGGVAPSVVTVPVQVTNQNSTPWTIQHATFTDRSEAERWGGRRRALANTSGRR